MASFKRFWAVDFWDVFLFIFVSLKCFELIETSWWLVLLPLYIKIVLVIVWKIVDKRKESKLKKEFGILFGDEFIEGMFK